MVIPNMDPEVQSIFDNLIASGIWHFGYLAWRKFTDEAGPRNKADIRLHGKIDAARDLIHKGQIRSAKFLLEEIRSEEQLSSDIRYRLSLNLGACALITNDLDTAYSEYKSATDILPDKESGWANLANVATLRGNYKDGVKLVEKALSISSSNIFCKSIACFVYYKANETAKLEKLESEIAVQNDSDCLLMIGQNKFEENKYQEAEELFIKALKTDQTSTELRIVLAQTILVQVQNELSLAPSNNNVLTFPQNTRLTESLRLLSEAQEALRTSEFLALLQKCYLVRSVVYLVKGMLQEAESDCNEALAIDHNDRAALRIQAAVLMLQGEYKHAIRVLEQLKEHLEESKLPLAIAHLEIGDSAQASSLFQQQWERCPDSNVSNAMTVATLLLKSLTLQGLKAEIQRVTQEITNRFGITADTLYVIARQRERERNYPEAAILLEQIMKIGSQQQIMRFQTDLAYIYCQLERFDEAIKLYESMKELGDEDLTNYSKALIFCEKYTEVIELSAQIRSRNRKCGDLLEAEAYITIEVFQDFQNGERLLTELVQNYPDIQKYKDLLYQFKSQLNQD